MARRHLVVLLCCIQFLLPAAAAVGGDDDCVHVRDPAWESHYDPDCTPNSGGTSAGYNPTTGSITVIVEFCSKGSCERFLDIYFDVHDGEGGGQPGTPACALVTRTLGDNVYCSLP